jgi:hypothetical protein
VDRNSPPNGATPPRKVTDELLARLGAKVLPASGKVYSFVPAGVWAKAKAQTETDAEPSAGSCQSPLSELGAHDAARDPDAVQRPPRAFYGPGADGSQRIGGGPCITARRRRDGGSRRVSNQSRVHRTSRSQAAGSGMQATGMPLRGFPGPRHSTPPRRLARPAPDTCAPTSRACATA